MEVLTTSCCGSPTNDERMTPRHRSRPTWGDGGRCHEGPAPRGLDVAMELRHECLDGLETLLGAQEALHPNDDHLVVDVVVEVEEVRFEQPEPAAAVERRSAAHGDRRRSALATHVDPSGPDAVENLRALDR